MFGQFEVHIHIIFFYNFLQPLVMLLRRINLFLKFALLQQGPRDGAEFEFIGKSWRTSISVIIDHECYICLQIILSLCIIADNTVTLFRSLTILLLANLLDRLQYHEAFLLAR